jgi:hypothetical protein
VLDSALQEQTPFPRCAKKSMQEFLRLGEIDEKWHVLLDKTFGPQVRQRLTQWVHSESVVMLAHQLTMHARTHNMPLSPPFNQERSTPVARIHAV